MKKTAFGIKLQNNPQTREEILDFHGVIGVESPYFNPVQKFHQWRC